MTSGQKQQLEELCIDIDIAEGSTRRADDAAQGKLHDYLESELRGHISIAFQHLQAAQRILAQQTQEAAHG